MKMSVEQSVEWLEVETEVLEGNLPCFVHHKSHVTWPGLEAGLSRLEPAANRLR
jgi:hypothetical protein